MAATTVNLQGITEAAHAEVLAIWKGVRSVKH